MSIDGGACSFVSRRVERIVRSFEVCFPAEVESYSNAVQLDFIGGASRGHLCFEPGQATNRTCSWSALPDQRPGAAPVTA